jgi:hypothetical protein
MVYPEMLRRVALVRTEVSEQLRESFIRVTGIGELETTLAVTGNRRKLVFLRSVRSSMACYGDILTFLYVDDVNTSKKTHLWAFTACYGFSLIFFWNLYKALYVEDNTLHKPHLLTVLSTEPAPA